MSKHAKDCNTQVGFSRGEICNCHPLLTEKVKHTGGPWTAHLNANAELSVFSGNEIIAVTWEPESFGDEGRAQEITQANARLIAASPEMLSALERVIRRGCGCSSNADPDWHAPDSVLSPGCPIPAVKAAIRRAKGE